MKFAEFANIYVSKVLEGLSVGLRVLGPFRTGAGTFKTADILTKSFVAPRQEETIRGSFELQSNVFSSFPERKLKLN